MASAGCLIHSRHLEIWEGLVVLAALFPLPLPLLTAAPLGPSPFTSQQLYLLSFPLVKILSLVYSCEWLSQPDQKHASKLRFMKHRAGGVGQSQCQAKRTHTGQGKPLIPRRNVQPSELRSGAQPEAYLPSPEGKISHGDSGSRARLPSADICR